MQFLKDPSVSSAEALGLSLIEARGLYDTWRANPKLGPRAISLRTAAASDVNKRRGTLYVQANRAKWASFNKPVTYRSPQCLCTIHESCKVCRAEERKRKPYAYSAAELAKATPMKRPFTTVLCGRKMGKTHAARQAVERRCQKLTGTRPLESTQQAKLLGLCRAEGWKAYKTEAPGFAGIPDLQVLKPAYRALRDRKRKLFAGHGRIAFVEMKRPGEQPTKLQLHTINELCAMGFDAFWADDPVKAFERLCELWEQNT